MLFRSAPFIFNTLSFGACTSLRQQYTPTCIVPWQFDLPLSASNLQRHLRTVASEDRDRVKSAWLFAIANGKDLNIEYRKILSNGSVGWALDVGNTFNDPKGRPQWLAGMSIDITKRKEAERLVWAAKEHAEDANRTKSEFLAHMSHEIRDRKSTRLNSSH